MRRIASLAKLSFDDAGERKLQSELAQVLDYMAQLDQVDTDGVVEYNKGEWHGSTREDMAIQRADQQELLQAGPDVRDKFFTVPKVIG